VLARAAQGQPVEFTRVAADCAPGPPPPPAYHLTTDNGQWIARAFAPCRLAGGAYDGVVVDRGYLSASRGSTATPTTALPPPVHVTGVLFVRRDDLPTGGLAHPAPVMISVEHETPAPPGVVAAPYDPNATGDLQYVGAYGPTWFGLAGVLACFYAAMLWRRNHPEKR
jgi:surfeit locus 1 family protein